MNTRSHALRGNARADALRRTGHVRRTALSRIHSGRRRRASEGAFPRRAWERDFYGVHPLFAAAWPTKLANPRTAGAGGLSLIQLDVRVEFIPVEMA
ncbi:MAG: hypothetical protein EXS05_08235 [Planctomycetaceae bacterium]|nr:hypothetical protein [Planctomycetaceae bacterium]